jgi:pyroglutamyl-peptidase
MPAPLLFLTGFEPFLEIRENPSGLVVEHLIAAPPGALRLAGGVLPVSIARVPAAFDALLADAPEPPAAFVASGVQRHPWFRLERRARAPLSSAKRDNDGRVADGVTLGGAAELVTAFELAELAQALRSGGAQDVRLSDDAGGFVCERAYHHALTRAGERGIPALFLHVPPLDAVPLVAQARAAAALLDAVAERVARWPSARR